MDTFRAFQFTPTLILRSYIPNLYLLVFKFQSSLCLVIIFLILDDFSLACTLPCLSQHFIYVRKWIAVVGCGGDRDTGKRPIMAKIATDKSDVCIFTADNPRSEDPRE